MSAQESFIQQYLTYVGDTECPVIFHRWSCLSMLGAFLGRDFYFHHGHFEIYPNLYVMLIGNPGTRKSTAIKLAKRIIQTAGYSKISSDKTSKEKFMLDLSGEEDDEGVSKTADDILEKNLFGSSENSEGEASEMYIACDEFNDFIGLGNLEFISLLGNLWDFTGTFKNRIKNGKSVSIPNPTVSILGGNTPTGFAAAFPPEALGQGFFSRLLLISGEDTGTRITFPAAPDPKNTAALVSRLVDIRATCASAMQLTSESKDLLDRIYKTYEGIEDTRFAAYKSRRFTHLLKLCLVIAASYGSVVLEEQHVVEANTILTYTEQFMPKALGEFGRAKNSAVTHKMMEVFKHSDEPLGLQELFAHMSSDVGKISELLEILKNLQMTKKIIATGGKFVLRTGAIKESALVGVDWNYLTDEERGVVI